MDQPIFFNLQHSKTAFKKAVLSLNKHGVNADQGIVLFREITQIKDLREARQNIRGLATTIAEFQKQAQSQIGLNLYLGFIDAKELLELCRSSGTLDFINLIYTYPAMPPKEIAGSKNELALFCQEPGILKDPKIYFTNFPFCFIPINQYKLLYRAFIKPFKGSIGKQEMAIDRFNQTKVNYLTACQQCNRKKACYALSGINGHPEYEKHLTPNTRSTLIFAGGSLREKDRCDKGDTVFTTPAEQGDMFSAILEGYQTILLLDGYFLTKFPPTTFEVLLSLRQGINVFGAASIGALRAVELDHYGMRGTGYVYNYLKKKHIKPYHVVAQAYDTLDRPLTVPLIDIIYFLEQSLKKKILTKAAFRRCNTIADNIHFTGLTFQHFFNQLRADKQITTSTLTKLESHFNASGKETFNIKRKDALSLMARYRSMIAKGGPRYVTKTFAAARDKYLKKLYAKYDTGYDRSLSSPPEKPLSHKTKKLQKIQGGGRERSVAGTLRLAEDFFSDLDIIIADISRYDFAKNYIVNITFIPLYFLRYSPSNASGKGGSLTEALVSAFMELLERIPMSEFKIKTIPEDKVHAFKQDIFPYTELPQFYNVFPEELHRYGCLTAAGKPIPEYIKATDLLTQKDFFLPKMAAYGSHSGSDGHASGNSLEEAIVYAIWELIERDTLQIYKFIDLKKQAPLIIDIQSIHDKGILNLIKALKDKWSCDLVFLKYTNVYDVPCVRCIIFDPQCQQAYDGFSVRDNLTDAIFASLSEAYSAYIVFYVGSRDDKTRERSRPFLFEYQRKILLPSKHPIQLDGQAPKNRSFPAIYKDLKDRLQKNGIKNILITNNSPLDKFKLKSVKVIIPGLELEFVRNFRASVFLSSKIEKTLSLIEKGSGERKRL